MEPTNKKKWTAKKPPPGDSVHLDIMAKLPPQSIDEEEAVLGCILFDPTSINIVIDIINIDCFYKEKHKLIYQTMLNLNRRSEPIDMITVCNECKVIGVLDEIGGAFAVASLTNKISHTVNIEYYARILVQQAIKRESIHIGSLLTRDAFDESIDSFDLIDSAVNRIDELRGKTVKAKAKGSMKVFKNLLDRMEVIQNSPEGTMTGVPSGFRELDKITNGFQNTDLIILAARPAVGKSAIAKGFMKGCIEILKEPVLMNSLEMSDLQVAARFISEDIGVSAQNLMKRNFTENTKVQESITKYFGGKDGTKELLIIDDSGGLSITELRARAKKVHAEKGISLIVIDYLQLCNASTKDGKSFGNRELEVSEIAKGLKNLAKELKIPVVALAQLSRKVETDGGDMRPKLSHLRESGSLEQEADIILFLYRPEYYFEQGHAQFENIIHCKTNEQISCRGYAELIIGKHRGGECGVVPLRFNGMLTKFEDWDKEPYYGTPVNENSYTNSSTLSNNKGSSFEEEPPF